MIELCRTCVQPTLEHTAKVASRQASVIETRSARDSGSKNSCCLVESESRSYKEAFQRPPYALGDEDQRESILVF